MSRKKDETKAGRDVGSTQGTRSKSSFLPRMLKSIRQAAGSSEDQAARLEPPILALPASDGVDPVDHAFDIAVVRGRFQISHIGHGRVLRSAGAAAPRVVVFLESSMRPRDLVNPFGWKERAEMIRRMVGPALAQRIEFVPLLDCFDALRADLAIGEHMGVLAPGANRVALIGREHRMLAEAMSDMHPRSTFNCIDVEPFPDAEMPLHAADIRASFFSPEYATKGLGYMSAFVHEEVVNFLAQFRDSHPVTFNKCLEEMQDAWDRQAGTAGCWQCTAAVLLEHNGRVMLIKGTNPYGASDDGATSTDELWSLPEGPVTMDEECLAAALRHLSERAGIRLSPLLAHKSIFNRASFHHPLRSARGRVLTEVFHIVLPGQLANDDEWTQVTPDAAEVESGVWVDVASVPGLQACTFEDHAHILDSLLGGLPAHR